MAGNGLPEYWSKLVWPLLISLTLLAVSGVITGIITATNLRSDVDSIKEDLGEGSFKVINLQIEQLGKQSERVEKLIEKQVEHNEELSKVIQASQDKAGKVDNLIDLILEERGREKKR